MKVASGFPVCGVAAAVALWLEKYKASLPRDWRRVEAVRCRPVGQRPVEGHGAMDRGRRRRHGFGDLVGNVGVVLRQEDLIVDIDVGVQGVRGASEQR